MRRGVYYLLDADRRPIEVGSVEDWAVQFERMNRQVAVTKISSDAMVSTVFLGTDHRHTGKGPPLLFVTMIFGGPLDQRQWRYASWDDAETGHKMAVSKARKPVGAETADLKSLARRVLQRGCGND